MESEVNWLLPLGIQLRIIPSEQSAMGGKKTDLNFNDWMTGY